MKNIFIFFISIFMISNTIFSNNLYTITGYGFQNPYIQNGTELRSIDGKIFTIVWDMYYKNSLVIYYDIQQKTWTKNKLKGQAFFGDDTKIFSVNLINNKIYADVYNLDFKLIDNLSYDYIPYDNQTGIRGLIPFIVENEPVICIPYVFEPRKKLITSFSKIFFHKETKDFSVKIISRGNNLNIQKLYNVSGHYFFSSLLKQNDFEFQDIHKNNDIYYCPKNSECRYIVDNQFVYEVKVERTRKFSKENGKFLISFLNPPEFLTGRDLNSIRHYQSKFVIHDTKAITYFCDYSTSLTSFENKIIIYYKKINNVEWSKKVIRFSKSISIDNLQIIDFDKLLFLGLRQDDLNNGGIFRMITLTEDELLSKDPVIEIEIDDKITTDADLVAQKNNKEVERWKAEKEKKGEKVNLKIN